MAARRVDRIHDVVQRPRQTEDVLAIERGDEGAVQALDDLVGQVSHWCSTSLISSALSQIGLSGASIASSSAGAAPDLLRHRHEIVVEPLFARNQSERHTTSKLRRAILADGPQI